MNLPIVNKKAAFDYFLKDSFEAGIVLTGAEVKSVRAGSVSLTDSFVQILDGEAYLINGFIAPYKFAVDPSYDPRRRRKLLLNRREIDNLLGQVAAGKLTIVPTKVYTRANLVKVEVALAAAKKKADKRESLKKKALQRETESFLLREAKIKSSREQKP